MKNRRIELILEEVRPGDSVLNVGCASCDHADRSVWLHRLLFEKASKVVGVDTCMPEDKTANIGKPNIVIADAQQMELGEKFDLIVAGEVIQHLPNPGLFLSRAREHLKEDGRMVITIPNTWEWIKLGRALFGRPSTRLNSYMCWYDKPTLAGLLNQYGFVIDRLEFVPRLPYTYNLGFGGKVVERLTFLFSGIMYRLGLKHLAGNVLFVKCVTDRQEIKK